MPQSEHVERSGSVTCRRSLLADQVWTSRAANLSREKKNDPSNLNNIVCVIVTLQLLDPSFATMIADPRGVHSRVMSPNSQLEVAGRMMAQQQALMTTMSRLQRLG